MLGGATVFCESIPFAPDITESSERLVDAMDLDGCSMVEFRRDREDGRCSWRSTPGWGRASRLAVRAGVDFPSLLHEWATGRELRPVMNYRIGERMRWLAGDMWYLEHRVRPAPGPDVPTPTQAVKTVLTRLRRASQPARSASVDGPDAGTGRAATMPSVSHASAESSPSA